MYIHEAIAKARTARDSVYRKAWLKDFVVVQKIRVFGTQGTMYHESVDDSSTFRHPWIPKAEDLLASDWMVYRPMPKSKDFPKR